MPEIRTRAIAIRPGLHKVYDIIRLIPKILLAR